MERTICTDRRSNGLFQNASLRQHCCLFHHSHFHYKSKLEDKHRRMALAPFMHFSFITGSAKWTLTATACWKHGNTTSVVFRFGLLFYIGVDFHIGYWIEGRNLRLLVTEVTAIDFSWTSISPHVLQAKIPFQWMSVFCVFQCSVTCGKGMQSRVIQCMHKITGRHGNECFSSEKPAAYRPCHLHPCNEKINVNTITSPRLGKQPKWHILIWNFCLVLSL